ncbi:MAG: tetratricopeptide repeat protein [Magnetococcales bacterium]|nr:tetratricopeptide repeat protein [Magnetococcales bacterium]
MNQVADATMSLGETLLQQGNELKSQRKYAEAMALYEQAIAAEPQLAEAHFALATIHHGMNRLDDAKACYEKTLEHKPSHVGAYNNLGVIFGGRSNWTEAAECYRRALQYEPESAELHNNLGVSLADLSQNEESMACYQRALELKPDYAEAFNNMGNLLKGQNKLAESVIAYQRSIEMKPSYHEAYNNLGTAYAEMGQLRDAIACYRQSLEIKSDYIEARNNLANNLLMLGEFEPGWHEYQWRRLLPNFRGMLHDLFPKPTWDGTPLNGRRILLIAEQGFGDAIHFVRYAPLVAARGGQVVLACQPALQSLLANVAGVAEVVNQRGPWPGFHEYAPLLCLPRIFHHNTVETLLNNVPYIPVDPALLASWRDRMPDAQGRLRVGLVWSGSPTHGRDKLRSIPLQRFQPLFEIPGIEFYSLQMGVAAQAIQQLPAGTIHDLSPGITTFADSAAILSQLDLLISIDSSPVHLSGALGIPTWTLITFTPDWRWLLQREDTPWYPSMRLFRQSQPAVWDDVLERVTRELKVVARAWSQGNTSLLHNCSKNRLATVPTITTAIVPVAPHPVIDAHRMPATTVATTAPANANPVTVSKKRLAVCWQLSQLHGWGLYGLNLAFTAMRMNIEAFLVMEPVALALNPLQALTFRSVLERSKQYIEFLTQNPAKTLYDPDAVSLMSSTQQLDFRTNRFTAGKSIGLTFFEDPDLSLDNVKRAADLPLIIAGSSWNERVLRQRYGLTNVRTIIQGVDTALFYPSSKANLLAGKFIIFGGGKLEHRKGQDLVIAAFQRFQARHADAFLLTAWNNHWLNAPSMRDMFMFHGKYIKDLPIANEVNSWLGKYLPAGSFYDVGVVSNPMIPPLLREADVAVLPSRCEGGTNLVAMECMAIGLPVILSANSGHLDLIGPGRCYPLTEQGPAMDRSGTRLLEGWGESSVEEIVAQLEEVYQNRDEAKRRGLNAHRFISQLSWGQQCEQVLTAALESQ